MSPRRVSPGSWLVAVRCIFWLAALPGMAAAQAASTAPAQHVELDGAMAAALLDAISRQFGGRPVDMQLQRIDARRDPGDGSPMLAGTGSVQVDGDRDPVGFRFAMRVDPRLGIPAAPDVVLGGVGQGERNLPNDSALLRLLEQQVSGELARRWHARLVRLQLDTIATVEAGTRYLSIHASGTADGGQGRTAPIRMQALYDRVHAGWVHLGYDVDAEAAGMADRAQAAID